MPEWVQWLVTAVAGLIGVGLGAALTTGRERAARRHRFVERQLEDFYSPMIGLRQEIRAKSELRLEISNAAGQAWTELCQETREADATRGGVKHWTHLKETRWPEFSRIIEYDNRQLIEELLPGYRKMFDLFRDNFWLAEDSTRSHYASLLGFVEMWNRWTGGSIPAEVVQRIDRREETLKAFTRTSTSSFAF